MKKLTLKQIGQLAKLANIELTKQEATLYTKQLGQVLSTISMLNQLNVTKITPSSHVTGLSNVFRHDKIDTTTTLSQQQALANSKTTHRGYFVVDALIDS